MKEAVNRRRAIGGEEAIIQLPYLYHDGFRGYVDTGVKIKSTTTFDLDSAAPIGGNWNDWIRYWDVKSGNGWKADNCFLVERNGDMMYWWYIMISGIDVKSFSVDMPTSRVVLRYDAGFHIVNNGVITRTYGTFTPRDLHSGSTLKVFFSYFYGLQVKESGVLVHDFVPAQKGSQVGIYDTIGHSFHPKVGSD